ncbi:MAG: hypothetical protein WAW06_12080 [bacterium]
MKSWLIPALAMAWAVAVPLAATAASPEPSSGVAVVDGSYSEWNLTTDFFADMYRAGDTTKVVESKLYLRYDCVNNTLYALVLEVPGVIGYIDLTAVTSWIAVDGISRKVVNEVSGNDGIPPDFAWIDRGYDGNLQHVRGYEASFTLVPGSYEIIAHTDVWDTKSQTSATSGFPKRGLVILTQPSAVEPSTFGLIKALYR